MLFRSYDVSNNQITGASFMGTVGLNWQFSGVGNFSALGESDMILRNSNTGGLQVYDITGSAFIGTVGLDWQFSGVGNFSGALGETDLLLRNNRTGGSEVYNTNHNQLTGAAFIGTVGLDWQFAGVGPLRAAGASDLVLRNVNTGAFQVYNITSNRLVGSTSLGSVGLDWQVGGIAVDPPDLGGVASELGAGVTGLPAAGAPNNSGLSSSRRPHRRLPLRTQWSPFQQVAQFPMRGRAIRCKAPRLRPPNSCRRWLVLPAAAVPATT